MLLNLVTASFTFLAIINPSPSNYFLQTYSNAVTYVLSQSAVDSPPPVVRQQLATPIPTVTAAPIQFTAAVLVTPSPTLAPTPDPTATPNPTETPTPTPVDTPTPKPTVVPTPTQTPTPVPTATPTPTSVATPAPTVAAPADLTSLFNKYADQYHVDANELKKIAQCESGMNPNSDNKTYDYGGMFQFSAGSWQVVRSAMRAPTDPALRFNAEEAIKTAAYKISVSGTGAWPACQ